jgi:hypothetical protein
MESTGIGALTGKNQGFYGGEGERGNWILKMIHKFTSLML